MNLYCKGYDVGNAFAEAPAPIDPFFMIPDAQFHQWWEEEPKRPSIPDSHVIPILKHYKDTWNRRVSGTSIYPKCLLKN